VSTPARGSAYFDDWYANMRASGVKDAILRRHLGLPEDLGSAGVLAWEALAEVTSSLDLRNGDQLVDIACGRGGYGIELARRTGSKLTGVDFSAVALEWARRIAAERLTQGQAEFRLGTLTETGLADESADALVCTDSIQFAEPPAAALAEFRRVLKPGGRLALTTWQPVNPGDQSVGPRLRDLDVEAGLVHAGFADVVVEPRPQWYAQERAAFEEAVATGNDGSDAALASFQGEGRRSLENWSALQRIAAYASKGQGR
jgi:SAM-dependent methyltransferase